MNCVELAKELVSIPSFNGNLQIAAYLKQLLEKNLLEVKVVKSGSTVNLISKIGNGKKSILFNAHLDTIHPAIGTSTTSGILQDGVLSGLGCVDMKSGSAAMICAFLELAAIQNELGGEVILVLVGDEEKGGRNGTNATVDMGFVADYVVIGEPTNMKICRRQKSALQLELIANGVAHHPGRQKVGENAIMKIVTALETLDSTFPLPTGEEDFMFNQTTMNVGTIFGGIGTNVVPDKCITSIDFRFSPSLPPEDLLALVFQTLENSNVKINEKSLGRGWSLDEQSDLCKAAISVLSDIGVAPEFITKFGLNDARFYVEKGCQVVNVGPGNNKLSHTPKEEIEASQIVKAKEFYVLLVKKLLS